MKTLVILLLTLILTAIPANAETPTGISGDFGDLPDPYPTLANEDGPYHSLGDGWLGQQWDAETTGQPEPACHGDDVYGTDDEDGVIRTAEWLSPGAMVFTVVVQGGGHLCAWFDWDADGGLEFTFCSQMGAGTYSIQVPIPDNHNREATFHTRWRLFAYPQLYPSPTGSGGDGEVEDHCWQGQPTAVTLTEFSAWSRFGLWLQQLTGRIP